MKNAARPFVIGFTVLALCSCSLQKWDPINYGNGGSAGAEQESGGSAGDAPIGGKSTKGGTSARGGTSAKGGTSARGSSNGSGFTSVGGSTSTGGTTATEGTTAATYPLGQSCTSAAQCSSNHCVDGVCCESACNGVCQSCGSAGLCNVTPTTDTACPAVTCPTNTTCATYTAIAPKSCKSLGVCNAASDCPITPAAARTSCATGSLCDGAGSCVAAQVKCGGSSCDLSYQSCCMMVDGGTYFCQSAGTSCGGSSQWLDANSSVDASCDQDSDCAIGKVCCMSNGLGNVSVSCQDATSCPSQGQYVTYYPICATPVSSTTCPMGTTCKTQFSGAEGQYLLPASWMTCV